jgi:hypothetical protein
MRFLTASECAELALQAGFTPGDLLSRNRFGDLRHAGVFPYKSRMRNANIAARHLADCLGNFTWALLWAHGLPWGDRSLEADPPQDWRDYARWRRSSGEERALLEAPGHLFEPNEQPQLVQATQFAIYTGWDAVLFANPPDSVIALSHDDFIQIQSRHDLAALSQRLNQCGISRESAPGSDPSS